MSDEPEGLLWHDREYRPLRGWVGPTRRRLSAAESIDCVRCGSTLINACYELEQQDKSSAISVCTTCCLMLQSSGCINAEDHLYDMSESRQREVMRQEFYDPASWRSAQFVLHLPDRTGIVIDGAVIEIDDDSYVQIVNLDGMFFWKSRFIDVYRSGDEAFESFDSAANHAFAVLMNWYDRL